MAYFREKRGRQMDGSAWEMSLVRSLSDCCNPVKCFLSSEKRHWVEEMVGKATKKKTLVDSTANFAHQPASDMSHYLAMVDHGKSGDLQLLHNIFIGLQEKANRQEQNRFFQSHKRKLKESISEESWTKDINGTKQRLVAMLRLYLDPQYDFQSSLEWMLLALKELYLAHKETVLSEIAMFCSVLFRQIESECLSEDFSSIIIDRVTYWMSAINGLTNINHEVGWLFADEVKSMTFFSFLVKLIIAQTNLINSESSLTSMSSRISKIMDDNLRCLVRNGYNVFQYLKNHECVTEKWQNLVTELTSAASKILSASSPQLFADKDIISATSSLYISLYFYQHEKDENKEVSMKFESIVYASAFSSLVQACLFKAYIHLYSLVEAVSFPSFLLNGAIAFILRQCQHHDCEVQLLGLQTMETWTFRVKEVIFSSSYSSTWNEEASNLMDMFMKIILMLITMWDHPVRQINHLVPSIFEKMLRFMASDVLRLMVASFKAHFWPQLFQHCMNMGSHYRGKYQALRIVLTVSGEQALSHLPPHFVEQVVSATQTRDIAAAVSFLVTTLCDLTVTPIVEGITDQTKSVEGNLLDADSTATTALKETLQQQLLQAIVVALCGANEALRKNTADYILPTIFKSYPAYALRMLQIWVQSSKVNTPDNVMDDQSSWGLMQLMVHCRPLFPQLQVQLDAVSASSEGMTSAVREDNWLLSREDAQIIASVLQAAYQSEDDDMRFSALTSLVTSLKIAAPISEEQFHCFLRHITYSLKTSDAENVQHLVRIVRIVLPRLKPPASINKSIFIMNSFSVNLWEKMLFDHLKSVLYPGITQDKEYAVLTLLHLLVDHFQTNNCTSSNTTNITTTNDKEMQIRTSEDRVLVKRLLQTYQSDWDKSRDVSMQIMEKLSYPWPGYESQEALQQLVALSVTLAMKAKLRESDAGAKLLRTLYRVYAMRQQLNLVSTTSVEVSESTEEMFINMLIHHVEQATQTLTSIFQMFLCQGYIDLSSVVTDNKAAFQNGEFPLVHGLLLSLRLIVEVTIKETGLGQKARLTMLRRVKQTLLKMTEQCFASGMSIVAEYVSDDIFSPANNNNENNDVAAASKVVAKGPINSATGISMAAVYVNSNTFTTELPDTVHNLKAQDNAAADNRNSDKNMAGLAAQRAIVAAWLLVKESAALFATMVDISSTPTMTQEHDTEQSNHLEAKEEFLTADDISHIAWTLLEALGRLKHMGAIAETHVALQTIVARVLRFTTPVPRAMVTLPFNLLQALIDRLKMRQQVFILRRSAGFAYSFLSILRAEPANASSAPLLHCAMSSLIQIVQRGLKFTKTDKTIANRDDKNSGIRTVEGTLDAAAEVEDDWKLSVHALNVLRLIILDGAFSYELDRYISPLFILTIQGFAHEEWAVRNSSMMVFSAMVQKCVAKDKNSSTKGHTSNNNSVSNSSTNIIGSAAAAGALSVSAMEFFRRYPGIDVFLVTRLTLEMNKIASVRDEHCLYPLLLLFAKFQAVFAHTDPHSDTNANSNIEVLIKVIRERYLSHASLAIRQVAARALSALVPIVEMPSMIHQLLHDAFPARVWTKARRALNKTVDDANKDDKAAILTMNELHGRLLTVLEMLQVFHFYVIRNRYQSHDHAQEKDIVPTLDPVGHLFYILKSFMNDSWLSQSIDLILLRVQCPLLHANWLQVLLILQSLQSYFASNNIAVSDRVTTFAMGIYQVYTKLSVTSVKELYLQECFLGELMKRVLPIVFSTKTLSFDQLVHHFSSEVKEIREGVIDALLTSSVLSQYLTAQERIQMLVQTCVQCLAKETDAVLQEKLWLLLAVLMQQTIENNNSNVVATKEIKAEIETEEVEEDTAKESTHSKLHPSLLSVDYTVNKSSLSVVFSLEENMLHRMETLCWHQIQMKEDNLNGSTHEESFVLQPRQCVASAMMVLQAIYSYQLTSHRSNNKNNSNNSSLFKKWLSLLKQAVHVENTQAFRLSAATTFTQSPLLSQVTYSSPSSGISPEMDNQAFVTCMCLLMKLLQDDDHEVRDTANVAAHCFLCNVQALVLIDTNNNTNTSDRNAEKHGNFWLHVTRAWCVTNSVTVTPLVRTLPPVVTRTLERLGEVFTAYCNTLFVQQEETLLLETLHQWFLFFEQEIDWKNKISLCCNTLSALQENAKNNEKNQQVKIFDKEPANIFQEEYLLLKTIFRSLQETFRFCYEQQQSDFLKALFAHMVRWRRRVLLGAFQPFFMLIRTSSASLVSSWEEVAQQGGAIVVSSLFMIVKAFVEMFHVYAGTNSLGDPLVDASRDVNSNVQESEELAEVNLMKLMMDKLPLGHTWGLKL